MKTLCIYLLIASLSASALTQCGAFRSQANRIQTARARRIDDALGE